MIIGITGYARSGKDTVSSLLVQHWGFTRVAFADPLREAVAALNPIVWASTGHAARHLQDVLKLHCPHGTIHEQFEAAKSSIYAEEIRRLLQVFGTEVGRQQFGEDFWSDLAMQQARKVEHAVLPDARFHNEGDAVHSHGGIVIRVNRPDLGPFNAHESERYITTMNVDYEIVNDSDLNGLRWKLIEIMEEGHVDSLYNWSTSQV